MKRFISTALALSCCSMIVHGAQDQETKRAAQAVVSVSNAPRTLTRKKVTTQIAKERELRAAASAGDSGYVMELLKDKTIPLNVDAVLAEGGYDKSTALQLASKNGHADVATLLIQAGADKRYTNKFNETALSLARKGKHTDVVRVLLKH